MVMEISFSDLVHIQPYLYLVKAFLNGTISPQEFETIFLDLRSNDHYLMSGRFHQGFENLINVLLNAVDQYIPDEMLDESEKPNKTEPILREEAVRVLGKFEQKINRDKIN